jgi:hypothetical protein
VSKPGKYHVVHDFSHPHSPLPEAVSINSHIDSNDFPCTWGTFSTVALLITRLPPGSQASIRDTAEAYRTIPAAPSQWPALSSVCRHRTSSQSTSATTLGLHRLAVSTAWLPTRVQTYSRAAALAHWRSGLTTTYSSGSHVRPYRSTMRSVMFRITKYTLTAGYGMEEKTYPMVLRRSSTKIAAQPSKTRRVPPPTLQRNVSSLTLMPTSTTSPCASESTGNPQNQSRSALRFLTSAFAETCAHAQSTCLKRRRSSTWQPSWSGRASARTTSSRPRSYTGCFFTPRWSSLQGELTSPAWRPCWPLSATIFSYRTPHPGTLQAIFNGGSSSSAIPRSQDPSQSPGSPPTTKPTPTPVLDLEWQSQSAPSGGRGGSPQDGNPKEGTSSGPRPLVSSYLSLVYAHCRARASTSQYMGTTETSSRDGRKDPATTSLPTASSAASSSYR